MKSLWKGQIFMTEKCFEERFRDVEENYKVITNRIAEAAVRSGRKPEDVTFLAATKTVPAEVINHAIGCGLRFIGENRVQEFMDKYEKIDWDKGVSGQIIGRLQTNKVKYIAPYISMVEAVDTPKLLREINKQAAKHDRVIDVLLELHIAEEETKYGLTLEACRELLEAGEWREMKNVHISGLMMMASNVEDEDQIRHEMLTAADFFDEVKARYFADDPRFCVRSWGMSHDYQIAVTCRSNQVRVGTAIFGPRVY